MTIETFADRLSLAGKTAFVTGGGGGIGRAIAIRLAEAGANVAVYDIFPERAEEAAARIREAGVQALAIPGDAMDSDAIRAGIAATDAQFGRLDILVNNAGGVSARRFLDQSERSWRKHIDINLVVSFTQSMALELSEHAIRVNCIAPDHTITPGNQGNRAGPVDPSQWKARTQEDIDAMNRLIPLGREGVDMECGDAAVFLCSAMASYITGIVLPVDGGTEAGGGWVRARNGGWTLNEGLNFGG